jgi:hypothetical protein
MAFQVGPACYASELQAAQAQASSQVGLITQHGGAAYVVNASAITGSSITYDLRSVDGATTLQVVAPFSAQPCGLLTAGDAVEMGWLIVGAWVTAYAIMFLARAIRGETGGEYGRDA